MKPTEFISTILQGLGVGVVGTIIAVAGLGRLGVIQPVMPYVVMSGSMEPALPVGSIVLVSAKPFGYAPGNVITFQTSKKGDPVTHRIVGLVQDDKGLTYQTKGDANEEADFALIRPDQVIGEAFYMIPHLGTIAHFAKQPYGFIILVVIPATVIVWEELKTVLSELQKGLAQGWQAVKRWRQHRFWAGFKPTQFVPATLDNPVHNARIVTRTAGVYSRSFVLVPILLVISALITFGTASYFSDNELSVGNVLGAASTYVLLENQPTAIDVVEDSSTESTIEEDITPSISPTPIDELAEVEVVEIASDSGELETN